MRSGMVSRLVRQGRNRGDTAAVGMGPKNEGRRESVLAEECGKEGGRGNDEGVIMVVVVLTFLLLMRWK